MVPRRRELRHVLQVGPHEQPQHHHAAAGPSTPGQPPGLPLRPRSAVWGKADEAKLLKCDLGAIWG